MKSKRFVNSLITGDNAGLHAILGYIESFSGNYPCRIRKIHRESLKNCVEENVDILRNVTNYEEDLQIGDSSKTGVAESCVWHNVRGFHACVNQCADFVHDGLEGTCSYTMTAIVSKLVRLKILKINVINRRITLFNNSKIDEKINLRQ